MRQRILNFITRILWPDRSIIIFQLKIRDDTPIREIDRTIQRMKNDLEIIGDRIKREIYGQR